MRLASVSGLALMAGLGLGPCVARAAAAEAQAADARPGDDQASAELREHDRHHHRGGVTQFIAMSLDTLGVDDARRPRIEELQADLYACMAPAGGIERKLHLTLADGTAAGRIDAAKVDAILAQLGAAVSAVHDCSLSALDRLHAILSPAERSALADKVQAHWEVWRQVNHEAKAGGREPGGRLAELATELGLAPDQVDRISVALHAALAGFSATFDPGKARAHVQAFASAFAGDSFDAKSIATNPDAQLAAHGARRMAIFYETVAPLLTPEQRATLAGHLREHADHQPALPAK